MTVNAMLFAFSHSKFPDWFRGGQEIASETSEKIKIPIKRATAAPIKDRMNPSERTITKYLVLSYLRYKIAQIGYPESSVFLVWH